MLKFIKLKFNKTLKYLSAKWVSEKQTELEMKKKIDFHFFAKEFLKTLKHKTSPSLEQSF